MASWPNSTTRLVCVTCNFLKLGQDFFNVSFFTVEFYSIGNFHDTSWKLRQNLLNPPGQWLGITLVSNVLNPWGATYTSEMCHETFPHHIHRVPNYIAPISSDVPEGTST